MNGSLRSYHSSVLSTLQAARATNSSVGQMFYIRCLVNVSRVSFQSVDKEGLLARADLRNYHQIINKCNLNIVSICTVSWGMGMGPLL